jgi:ribosome-associated protein YbcJ (S4-like RNA binding protein)
MENLRIGSAGVYTLKTVGSIQADTFIMEGHLALDNLTINAKTIDIRAGGKMTVDGVGSIQADTVITEGHLAFDNLTINAKTIDIRAGGKVSADGVTTSGPGRGNSNGSGGKWVKLSIIFVNNTVTIA